MRRESVIEVFDCEIEDISWYVALSYRPVTIEQIL